MMRPMDPKTATEKLRASGFTLLRIAVAVGVTPSTIFRIANGSEPTYGTGVAIIALAKREAKKAA